MRNGLSILSNKYHLSLRQLSSNTSTPPKSLAVIGGGLAGTRVSYAALQKGWKVNILNAANFERKPSTPWGVVRELGHSSAKTQAMPNPVEGLNSICKKSKISDPTNMRQSKPYVMLENHRPVSDFWQQSTEDNNATYFNPTKLQQAYNIEITAKMMGLSLNAQRNTLLDVTAQIAAMKKYMLEKFPEQLTFHENTCVNKINYASDGSIKYLNTNRGDFDTTAYSSVLFSPGPHAYRLFNHIPVQILNLPYAVYKGVPPQKLGGYWAAKSSACWYGDFFKLGCGVQSIAPMPNSLADCWQILRYGPHHLRGFTQSYNNLHLPWKGMDNATENLLNAATSELNKFYPGILDNAQLIEKNSCEIDATPSMNPFIDLRYTPQQTWMILTGFSGSGCSMFSEESAEHLLESLETGELAQPLQAFKPSQHSFFKSVIKPPPELKSGISAMPR